MSGQCEVLTICGYVSKCVGDIEIVDFGVRVPLSDCGSQIITSDVFESEVEGYRYGIAFIAARIESISLNSKIGLQSWDIHLLYVSAGIDEKGLGI